MEVTKKRLEALNPEYYRSTIVVPRIEPRIESFTRRVRESSGVRVRGSGFGFQG